MAELNGADVAHLVTHRRVHPENPLYFAPLRRAARMTLRLWNAESARTTIVPDASRSLAVRTAETTIDAAPRAGHALPARIRARRDHRRAVQRGDFMATRTMPQVFDSARAVQPS
jgi:hypothetical protein